jgi:predicted RNA-binding Zn-ribbon protein involved in translation (DUF1610 family)
MRMSKKPKSVIVRWEERQWIHYYSIYQCPHCRVEYQNTLDKKITRFKCECGQELIIK